MSHASHASARIREEHLLINQKLDFPAAYMGVKYIARNTADDPSTLTRQTLEALFSVFSTPGFNKAKQAFFLYHETACTLVSMGKTMDNETTRTIVPRLVSVLMESCGKKLSALGQALGLLADNTLVAEPPVYNPSQPPLDINLSQLAKQFFSSKTDPGSHTQWTWKGRSLILRTETTRLGVIKFARTIQNINEIAGEAAWMDWFSNPGSKSGLDADSLVPQPVSIQGQTVFHICDKLPQGAPAKIYGAVCIAFIPCPGYYDYPNSQGRTSQQIKQSFFKSAHALGRMSSQGLFHTALIPLFHNRVQQNRRNDNGQYLWEHAGRLDQWLDSSRFPNFAQSGLRDFEHIVCQKKPLDMQHYTGEYLLSFILVAGSCFRNKAPDKRGTTDTPPFVDTRDLFCPDLFKAILTGVCEHYFKGLTQQDAFDPAPFNIPALVDQLIEKMGMDEHMQETLRIHDQQEMDDDQFEKFLRDRGLTKIPARGKEEIILITGPHLGGFNQSISIPELIEFLFKFSAFCVATCYLNKGIAQK